MTLSENQPEPAAGSPCSEPQQAAARHCAAAEQLADAARVASDELVAARRQRAEVARRFETDARLGDRRVLADAKAQARQAYRTEYQHSRDGGTLMGATAAWMSDVSSLNRRARRASREAEGLSRRQADIEAAVERLELAADAARIAAASARAQCLDARRALAACEEAHDARLRPAAPPPAPATAAGPAVQMATPKRASRTADPAEARPSGEPAVVAWLRGDRRMLQSLVSRLAEEIGQDAGRLQLLMLDLRDSIISAGRDACAFDFPPRHPFWSQFSKIEARAVAAGLATLNRRFDGLDGWYGGQVALPRELAMAMSLAGRDPRSVRPFPTAVDIETLWRGTTVAAAEFLFASAPDLRLEGLTGLLGPRADALAELWDNWGRLRPLLLGSDALLT